MSESAPKQEIFDPDEWRQELFWELKGTVRTLYRQLSHRFGPLAPEVLDRLVSLDQIDLDDLSIALFKFQRESDLRDWLERRAA
jgi:hypothetical protein